MTLGDRILKARKMARQSREKLSRSIDMSSRTIERWENGNTEPNAGDIAILARALDVNESWLRTGEGEMFSAYDAGLSQAGATMQTTTPTHHSHTTSTTGGDMIYDPSWVVPILLSAYIAVMHSSDLEKARRLKEAGRRFRVRLVVEEEDRPPDDPSP